MSIDTIGIASPDGSTVAAFAPAAGMVCASLTIDGIERLDQRGGLDAYAEKGSTMGIPLLYPWANRLSTRSFEVLGKRIELPEDPALIHTDGGGAPIHGLVPSLMRWDARTTGDGAGLTARLSWTDRQLLELFPFPHALEFRAEVSTRALAIEVGITTGPSTEAPVSFGFHPYLSLGEVPRDAWTIELPDRRALTLDDRMLPTGERVDRPAESIPLGHRAFDDALELTGSTATFTARAPERSITVAFGDGYHFAQVFSPSGAGFVCFEPMTSPANALVTGDSLELAHSGRQTWSKFQIFFSR